MKEVKVISGDNLDEIWRQLAADIDSNGLLLQYNSLIDHLNKKIFLEIDIDPGGGFESGYQTTKFSSRIQNSTHFEFAIHHQGFIDEIGKFFGMQDVITGFPEFDKKVIVKTNDEAKVISIFSDEKIRNVFKDLTDFVFHTTFNITPRSDSEGNFIELNIEDGITDPIMLREIYEGFYLVLIAIDPNE